MTNLNPELQNLFTIRGKIFKRAFETKKRTNTMEKEFIYILEKQCGSPFAPNDWDPHDYTEYDYDTNKQSCICTHEIKHLYMITHKPTNISFQVGSDCIFKLGDIGLTQKMHKVIKSRKMREIGCICIYCAEPLLDRRKKVQREGFCDKSCMAKMNYVIPFGKHKGKLLVELLCMKNDTYLDWVKNERKEDPTAFSKFVLFLEIIDETVVETVVE